MQDSHKFKMLLAASRARCQLAGSSSVYSQLRERTFYVFADSASRRFDVLLCLRLQSITQTPSAMGGRHPHLLHYNYCGKEKQYKLH